MRARLVYLLPALFLSLWVLRGRAAANELPQAIRLQSHQNLAEIVLHQSRPADQKKAEPENRAFKSHDCIFAFDESRGSWLVKVDGMVFEARELAIGVAGLPDNILPKHTSQSFDALEILIGRGEP